MDSSCKLRATGWIYVLVGTYALIEQSVSLFLQVDDPLMSLHLLVPRVNLVFVALPIGIGLLRRSNLCRKLAVGLNWLIVGTAGVLLALLLFGVLAGKASWNRPEDPVTGDDVSRMIGMIVLGIPLFVWQFRALHSEDVRRLTEATSG